MGYVTTINNETTARRNQLKSVMDDFCTFSWGGCPDMFGEYGAFIVGGKDALKFYNGPGFSNEYAQPQFNKAAGQLQGVNFTTQQISFTMGVYWITEEDYRKLIHLLHPLRVSFLAFGFETKYGYQAKLSKLGDSTRNPIGRNEDGKIVYYTEIPLTFEVQGAQCATAQNQYDFKSADSLYLKLNENDHTPSDLPFPIEYSFKLTPLSGGLRSVSLIARYYEKTTVTEKNYNRNEIYYSQPDEVADTINLPGEYYIAKDVSLFDLKLQLTTQGMPLNIKYKSDLGTLFLEYGSGIDRILSLTTYSDIGDFIVKSLLCNKFEVPGILDNPLFDLKNVRFILKHDEELSIDDIDLVAYARTNVI